MKKTITFDELTEFLGVDDVKSIKSITVSGEANDRITVEQFVYYPDTTQRVFTHRSAAITVKTEIALVKA